MRNTGFIESLCGILTLHKKTSQNWRCHRDVHPQGPDAGLEKSFRPSEGILIIASDFRILFSETGFLNLLKWHHEPEKRKLNFFVLSEQKKHRQFGESNTELTVFVIRPWDSGFSKIIIITEFCNLKIDL